MTRLGVHSPRLLRDAHHRPVRYLRLSLTKACSMRCAYCRPDFDTNHDRGALLTPTECAQLAGHLVRARGLTKVRLTGGEPTTRADLVEIVERLAQLEPRPEITLTTNALALAKLAAPLKRAGLGRVNVSLDTLDRARFAELTGVDGLARVRAGVDAARAAGLGVKLNSVVVRGANDDGRTGGDLVRYAARVGAEMRFIELMPMGPLAPRWRERYVTAAETKQRLVEDGGVDALLALPRDDGAARRFRALLADGGEATVGLISPMSDHFCDRCTRLRVGGDGNLYPCLMDVPRGSALAALRPRFDARALDRALDAAFAAKAEVHPAVGFATMTHLGG